jgi:putative transposase
MLTMNYTYRIYPNLHQSARMLEWLETSRQVYNRALRELKDWINSRKCWADRCSLEREYIVPADAPFPSYHRQQNDLPKLKESWTALKNVHSQVLQTTIRRLHDTWEAFQERGHGFPRFKKFGQFKSFVFPQFKVLLRGLNLVPVDNRGMETACAGVLPGSETARPVPKSRKGTTRKSKK